MTKGISLVLVGLLTMTLSAEAKVVRLTGQGVGGTNQGDKEGACDRAYERAEDDGRNQCDNRDGDVVDFSQIDCRCRNEGHNKYKCNAQVRVSCDVPCRPNTVLVPGSGLGIDYDRRLACEDGFRRATDDTVLSCQRRGGFVTSTDELNCNCRRLSGGDYECRTSVESQCEVSSCR